MDDFRDLNILNELLRAAGQYLEKHGVSEAKADADLLLAFVLGVPRDRLYWEPGLEIAPPLKEKYLKLLVRRAQREPLAYLLKYREFMGLVFYVDNRVLIPRPETELLVEKALEYIKKYRWQNQAYCRQEKKVKILDLCTGSGAVAVSLARFCPEAALTATDLSSAALEVARYNAAKMQVAIDFRQGDLFQPVTGEKFDLIVANPPYVSEKEYALCAPEVKKEPKLALLAGEDGLDFYRKIASQVSRFLYPGGAVLLEIGCSQGQAVRSLFARENYETTIFLDYAGLDRIVLACRE